MALSGELALEEAVDVWKRLWTCGRGSGCVEEAMGVSYRTEYEVMIIHTVPLLSAALCGAVSTVAISRNYVQRGISVHSFWLALFSGLAALYM
jgi:hypothetical protein